MYLQVTTSSSTKTYNSAFIISGIKMKTEKIEMDRGVSQSDKQNESPMNGYTSYKRRDELLLC